MKRSILFSFFAAAILFSLSSEAQIPGVGKIKKALPEPIIGVKLGANFQEITGSKWESTYKPGIVGGLFVGLQKGKVGVQAEGLIKSVNFQLSAPMPGAPLPSPVKGVYLDVPLMFEYKIISRIWAQIGPQYSMMISAKQDSKDVKDSFKPSEFSGVLGLQAILPVHLTAGVRYVLGFTDISNSTATSGLGTATSSWKSRMIQVSVGWRFL